MNIRIVLEESSEKLVWQVEQKKRNSVIWLIFKHNLAEAHETYVIILNIINTNQNLIKPMTLPIPCTINEEMDLVPKKQ